MRIDDALADYPNVECYEDPVPKNRPEWYGLLRQKCRAPIALHSSDPKLILDHLRHDGIDIVNVGSVAVTPAGGRTGKGAGFADLELALLRDAGLVDESTAICTTVHPLSVVDDALLPMTPTDSTVDYIVTETETLRATSPQSGPTGIQWDLLEADQIESIPILAMLNAARTPGSAE